ncbi:MAG: SPOR domain-containing protein [Candidatus Eiseniibacteriota bacterium]|nr:MAG: SPOR domain-containing protein [Candidatus Eisenbacteria bacterium]
METKRPGFEDAFFSGRRTDPGSNPDFYRTATEIADDLKTPLLAELMLTEELRSWERDLSALSDYGWAGGCTRIAEELVRLRETLPLDLVGVVGLTDGVYVRPLLCSLGLVMRGLLQRVVLVDCDLRNPSLHTVTDSQTREGFIDMVKYGCSFFTAASETEEGGIYVIAAGSHPVSSEGELQSRELERVFHSLRAKADMTLVSVPRFVGDYRINPILEHMDGVLLCVNRLRTQKRSVKNDFSRLWQSDIPLVGLVSQETSEVGIQGEAELKAGAKVEVEAQAGPEAKPDVEEKMNEAVDDQAARPSVGALPGHESPPRDKSDETPLPDETDVVETALFGKQRRRRKLPYIIGICAAATIMGFLGVREAGFFGPGGPEMDSRTVRSLLLPGSDGVTNAVEEVEEVSKSPAETVSSSSESAEPSAGQTSVPAEEHARQDVPGGEGVKQRPAPAPARGTAQPAGETNEARGEGELAPLTTGAIFVHVSSFREYGKAAKDSSRVAALGLETSIVLVTFEDLGTWYRVLVGPFDKQVDAEIASGKLVSSGLVKKTRIISEGGTD